MTARPDSSLGTALDRHVTSRTCHQHALRRPAPPSLVQERPERTLISEHLLETTEASRRQTPPQSEAVSGSSPDRLAWVVARAVVTFCPAGDWEMSAAGKQGGSAGLPEHGRTEAGGRERP
jgi:hypothetical protein